MQRQLHDLICSKPAMKVAQEFGVSGVAVAVEKVCQRGNNPTPPPGYRTSIQQHTNEFTPKLTRQPRGGGGPIL